MATDDKRTMADRLQAWSDEVAETYIAENENTIEEVAKLGGPDEETTLAAIEWSNHVDRNNLLFMLAICVAEVTRRWGVEATNETLSALLDTPAIAAIGEVVHAFNVVDEGGVPERFMAEDLEAAFLSAVEGEDTFPDDIKLSAIDATTEAHGYPSNREIEVGSAAYLAGHVNRDDLLVELRMGNERTILEAHMELEEVRGVIDSLEANVGELEKVIALTGEGVIVIEDAYQDTEDTDTEDTDG